VLEDFMHDAAVEIQILVDEDVPEPDHPDPSAPKLRGQPTAFRRDRRDIELISKPGIRLEYTRSLDDLPRRGRPMGFQELTDEP
jgi:hypothetical protein